MKSKNRTHLYMLSLSFFLTFSSIVKAQDLGHNYAIGFNIASVLYSEKDGATVGGRYIATLPGISVSRYLGDKMTISATFSKSINDTQKYFSSDLNLTYDIFNPENRLRPYILGGLGIVNLLDSGLTVNTGAGGTLWVTDSIGLNAQLIYKNSLFGSELQKSHFFSSAGLVFSFNVGGKKRIWE